MHSPARERLWPAAGAILTIDLGAIRANWRWLRDRADTPWYPTMRLFRQERPMAWDGVLARTAAELARVAAGERGLLLPESMPS